MSLSQAATPADEWKPVEGHLLTRWAQDVDPKAPWPEYPRPKMVRENWMNLNGLWDYAIVPAEAQLSQMLRPLTRGGDGQILVPFCAESALSGVGKRVMRENSLWYHRSFEVPADFKDERMLLHFGAVDWECTVWVNGHEVGNHKGGYDPFNFDVTEALQARENQIIVRAWDATSDSAQPRGKQLRYPGGIWYTPVTGIWQTVWLEPVPKNSIERLQCVPDIDAETLTLTAHTSANAGAVVWARVMDGYREVAKVKGIAGQPITLPIEDPKLWAPGSPFLYDLEVALDGGDKVSSYFGMRKISMTRDGKGIPRIALNNETIFQYGPLDQGWWPDGLYTPANEAALLYDLEVTQDLGMNLVRKHVKVELERFYYHCDQMGLLVWQDMPNGTCETDPAGQKQFRIELERMIDAFEHYPSIVMWVPFNEAWGQHDAVEVANWVKQRDPSRLVNETSGWNDEGSGDIIDLHIYQGPGIPEIEDYRAAVMGEFGGLGYAVKGHLWSEKRGAENWGYGDGYPSQAHFQYRYEELMHAMRPMIDQGLCAAVYTQTSDVEGEINGFMTYDREVVKLDPERSAAIHDCFYDLTKTLPAMPGAPAPVGTKVSEEWIPLVETSQTVGQTWSYTTSTPAADWMARAFDDSVWQVGEGMFGAENTPGVRLGTAWTSSDIYLRRSFDLVTMPAEVRLRLYHDEAVKVYINGRQVKSLEGYTTGFIEVGLDNAEGLLNIGENTIAVHCHQVAGGQGVDVGLIKKK